MSLAIRRARSAVDHSLLWALQQAILPYDTPKPTETGWWWLAWQDGAPVAFGGVVLSAQWTNARYLCRAGVLPEARGRGLQRRLIGVREAHARRSGAAWLITDTTDNFASANSLIACEFRLYQPSVPWAFKRSLYWRKALT